ncbi:MAG: FecR domain-containing protein [Phaeodactylibacter sp.]|nr:FecR domain-containing protein [Phaeodactylibacter sp.]MCB9290497.1 FecR domain-containing protein [Lewinellaceae bacterium]
MNDKDYANFSIRQLASDPDFQRWVRQPSREDLLFWQVFLRDNPNRADEVAAARREVQQQFGLQAPGMLSAEKKQQMHDRLMEAIRQDKRRRIRRWAFSTAAAVLVLVLAGMAIFGLDGWGERPMVVHHTPYGQTEEIALPDGSQVVLNANSTLTYAQAWKKGADRQVWLKGEAHFTVAPKPATKAKFTVITDDLSVNVLGTIFNVYARETGTEVTLEEGKIKLELEKKPGQQSMIDMAPGEKVEYSAKTGRLKEEKANIQAESAWKEGVILFDGITLGQLGLIITETFGRPVEFQDSSMMQQLVTGAGPADDLKILLETAEKAFDVKVVEQDSLLIFKRN